MCFQLMIFFTMMKSKLNLVTIVFCDTNIFFYNLSWPLTHRILAFLIMEVIIFYVLERHRELVARADHLLTSKLQVEQEEVETMRGINKILLGKASIEKKMCFNLPVMNFGVLPGVQAKR